MALTPEQVKELKDQLREQIKNLPEDKKSEALQQIESMSNEALEEMISQQQGRQQVFRMIVEKQIPSTTIDENPDALAVLEIRPASKGHLIVIPKKAITSKEEINQGTKDLAESVAKKVKDNLSASDIKIIPDNKFGEIILDIIPVYDTEVSLDAERKEADKKDLEDVAKKINTIKVKKTPVKIEKKSKPKKAKVIKLPRRIP
jgi:histidine triad (HIT) family protein